MSADTMHGACLDVEGGLVSCSGRHDLYRSLLVRLSALAPDLVSQISDSLASGDMEHARILSHQLKGSSAALGAMRVFSASSSLEMACASGPQSSALDWVGVLQAEVGRLRAKIAAHLDVPAKLPE